MKNQIQPLLHEIHATHAVQRIVQWVELKYPKLAAITKTQLILECLIEVTEEEKFIAAQ